MAQRKEKCYTYTLWHLIEVEIVDQIEVVSDQGLTTVVQIVVQLRCTKQFVTTAAGNVRFLLDQPAVNQFFAATALKIKEVDLNQEDLKTRLASRARAKRADQCLMLFVLNAETTVKFHFNPALINLFTAAIVLERKRMLGLEIHNHLKIMNSLRLLTLSLIKS